MAGRLVQVGRLGQHLVKPRVQRALGSNTKLWRGICTTFQCYGDAVQLKMPALSPTMQEGTIVKWYKQEGDPVAPGEVLCDIQTDKAVVSLEVEDEGTLAKILKPDDSKNVVVGTLIALIAEEGDDWRSVQVPADSGGATEATAEAPSGGQDIKPSTSTSRLGYGPAVRTLLDTYQLQVSDIPATGPHGRLLKGDLLTYIKLKGLKPAAAKTPPSPAPVTAAATAPPSVATPAMPSSVAPPAPPAPLAPPAPPAFESEEYEDQEITSMRRTIAKRLTESKATVPHAYSSIDCNIGKLLTVKKEFAADGIKLSVNDFIVKACGVALQRVPEVNAFWTGDGVQLNPAIDVCVAVATPSGLITPIVKNASEIGIQEISNTVKELAGRAHEGRLKPAEFMGGSFTISNLGMFGISHFTAVINPPQSAIMAVGTSRLVPTDDEGAGPETHMTVTLSSDARVVDDTLAARFLQVFRETMENPMLMMSQPGPKAAFKALEDDDVIHVGLLKERLFT